MQVIFGKVVQRQLKREANQDGPDQPESDAPPTPTE